VKHLRVLPHRCVLILTSLGLGLLVACTATPAPIRVAAPAEPTVGAPAAPAAQAPVVAAVPQSPLDAQHSGRSPYAGPSQPTLLRSFDSAALPTAARGDPRFEIQSSAAIAPDGTMYLGNFPGNLMALRDPGAGSQLELLWSFHPAGASSFHSTPAIDANGTIFIGFSTGGASPDAHGTFYALDPGGQVVWTVDLGGGRQTSSPVLGPDGTIYVTSGAGKLFAISPAGQTLWTAQTGPMVKASPALGADGTVYVASMNDKLYAVRAPLAGQTEGSVRWTFQFGQFPGEKPAVTAAVPPPGADGKGSGATPTIGPDGTIYIGADNSNMYAVAPDGQLKWMFEAERAVAGIWSSALLSADGQRLYFGANQGGVYALKTADGSLDWQYPIVGSVYNSLTLDRNGVLYTGSTAGHLIAIDATTGANVWDFTNPDAVAVWTAPVLRSDGDILIGDTAGFIRLVGRG
jgi:outer membrane protein assembly factor BamB